VAGVLQEQQHLQTPTGSTTDQVHWLSDPNLFATIRQHWHPAAQV
jgi:hypothetical protein